MEVLLFRPGIPQAYQSAADLTMEDNAELESFRRQWREEVSRRTGKGRLETAPQTRAPAPAPTPATSTSTARLSQFPPTRHEAFDRKEEDEEEENEAATTANQEEIIQQVGQLSLGAADEDASNPQGPEKEPRSAVEHFEKAVQKEEEGSLGDSLHLYRKAYRVRLVD